MLFGKERFRTFCSDIARVSGETDCSIHLSLTTNGILIDEEWAVILSDNNIDVTLSIDGPTDIHDKHRVDFKGLGTLSAVEAGLGQLRRVGISPGVLAVCDPQSDPREVLGYFIKDLGLKKFDILVPDSTHEDYPESIEPYFKALFDAWYPTLAIEGVDIRYLSSMMKGLLGGVSKVESIGYGPINTVCMLTGWEFGAPRCHPYHRNRRDGDRNEHLRAFIRGHESLFRLEGGLRCFDAPLCHLPKLRLCSSVRRRISTTPLFYRARIR